MASYSKLRRQASFRNELAEYELLPRRVVPLAAFLIPVVELAVTVSLLVPSTRMAGALAAVALLTVFTAAIVLNLRRGRREISCACFGSDEQRLGWDLVARNGLLAAVALVVAMAGPATDQISFAAAVVTVEAAVLAVLFITFFSTVERLRRWSS